MTDPAFETADETRPSLGWGDYCVPVVVFVFCGLVTYFSLQLEEALPLIVGHSMQPRVWPIFLMAVIGVLNLLLIAQILSQPASRRNWEPYQTWASAVLLGVFYLIATYLDMMLALMVVMFTLCMVWGERRWWVAAVTAVATTAFIFFTFDLLLEVRFPRGILTDPYYG